MSKQKLIDMLAKEGCSKEFIAIALKHAYKFDGDILNFIETVESHYATKDITLISCGDFVGYASNEAGILISEQNYNGNTLEAHGYIYETDDGRKY